MKIQLTLREIINSGYWNEFCFLKGYNVFCLQEGRASENDVVYLTYEECEKIGLKINKLLFK